MELNLSHEIQIRCAILLTLAGIGAAAHAELTLPKVHCQDPQKLQTLILKVEAKSIVLNGRAGLHWVIELPAGDDIQVSDPGLKSAIQEWIASQNSLDPKVKHPWVLDGRAMV